MMNNSIKKMNNNFYAYNLNNDCLKQKRYSSNLQQIELKNQVILSHETYLQLDDEEQRANYRKKLHKYVVDFLLKIPHQNKFILPDFYFIFDKCVEDAKFDPLKSAESFEILFRITNNLILKPWRKEYSKINIYNAYFKYLVSEQIPHYKHLLKLMGYELKNKDGILNCYLIKRNSLELLKLISFDCFICYVELRFFYQFGEILKSKKIKPNWSFILKLRKKLSGNFETTLENYLLIYQDQIEPYSVDDSRNDLKADSKNELKNNIDEQQLEFNKKYKHLNNLINKYEQNKKLETNNLSAQNNLIDLESFIPAQSVNSYESLEKLLLSTSPTNYSQPTSTYNHQPIQIDQSNDSINPSTSSTSSLKPLNNSYLKCSDNNYSSLLTNKSNQNGLTFNETDLDQVDLVDDELTLKNELNSKIKCLDSNAQKLELALKSDNEKLTTSLVNGKIKSNSLEKKSKNANKTTEKKYSTLDCRGDKKKTIKNSILSVKKKDELKVSCKHCTYHNDAKDEICKMCSKSMKPMSTKNELTVLGKECTICTLVNKKNEFNCQACGSDLKNSPTYI